MPNAAGPGGHEVGRISIRVVPDTDGFRLKLEKGLKKETSGVNTEVGVDLDPSGLREKVKALAKAAETKIKIGADLEDSEFLKLAAKAKAMARAAGLKLDLEFNDPKAEADLARLIAKLKAEAKMAGIKIKVDLDRKGLFAKGGKLGFLGAPLRGLDKLRQGLMKPLQAISDDTILILFAALAAGAPILGTVSGALAGLPALLSAVVAPAAAVALGFDGIKKALENVGLATEGKKGKLAPGDFLKQMQTDLSNVFETGLTPVFTKMLDLGPVVTGGLTKVAQALVNTASSITDVVTSSKGLTRTENILGNVAKLGDALAPGWARATDALMALADRGSNHLEGLGKWFTDVMNQVGDSIDSVIANGKFDKVISGLKPVLEGLKNALGKIFGEAFDWFSNPANSQRTGDFIEQLGSLVKGALKVSEVVFPILERLGNYVGQLVDQFSTSGKIDLDGLLGQIGSDIAGSAKWGEIGKSIGSGILHGIWGAIKDGFTSDAFLQAIPVVGSWAVGLKHLFGGGDGDAGKSMVDAIIPPTVSPELKARAESNAQQFASSVAQSTSVEAIQNAILGGTANSSSSGSWESLFAGPEIPQQIASGFGASLDAAVPQIQQQVTEAKKQITEAVKVPAGTGMDGGAGFGVGAATQLAQDTAKLKETVASGLSGLKQTASEKFEEVVTAAQEAIDKIIPKFAELPGKIVSALGDLGSTLTPAGESLMAGLGAGMEAGFQAILNRVRKMASEIAANKGPLPYDRQVLTPNGFALMEGLQDGIEGGFEGVISRARQLAEELGGAINDGVGAVNGGNFPDRLKQQIDELELERKTLKVQLDGTTDKGQKAAIRDQMKQVQTLKDQLRLQQDQLGYSQKYGDSVDENQQRLQSALQQMAGIGQQFATANLKQFQQDLGWSGSGMIPSLIDQGIGFLNGAVSQIMQAGMGGGTTIQVNSVDEAFAAKQTADNRQALKYNRR